MLNPNQWPRSCRRDTKLLMQFTPQTLFNILPNLKLPARKFPQAALMYMRWTFAEQHLALRINNGRHSHMYAPRPRTHSTLPTIIRTRVYIEAVKAFTDATVEHVLSLHDTC